jgi:hypothetical protein
VPPDNITLHRGMTAQQIAEWCRTHGMFVTIDWTTDRDGFLTPLMQARREVDPEHVPAFLKRQAE